LPIYTSLPIRKKVVLKADLKLYFRAGFQSEKGFLRAIDSMEPTEIPEN
jgi:hypothetical protein